MASQGGGSPSEVGITWRRRNDETRPGAPVVGPDEVQHLVDAIVPIIKTHPTR